jgi:hypothetical protein
VRGAFDLRRRLGNKPRHRTVLHPEHPRSASAQHFMLSNGMRVPGSLWVPCMLACAVLANTSAHTAEGRTKHHFSHRALQRISATCCGAGCTTGASEGVPRSAAEAVRRDECVRPVTIDTGRRSRFAVRTSANAAANARIQVSATEPSGRGSRASVRRFPLLCLQARNVPCRADEARHREDRASMRGRLGPER